MAIIPAVPAENLTIGHIFVIGLNLIKGISGFSTMLAVGAIVWGGVVIIGSGGNEEKVKSGKGIVIYATAGLVVILLAWVLVSQTLRLIEAKCPYGNTSTQVDSALRQASRDPKGVFKQELYEALKKSAKANPECINLIP